MFENSSNVWELCYMNRGTFIVYIKIEDIYADITKDIEARFDTSKYELDRPLLKKIKINCINE